MNWTDTLHSQIGIPPTTGNHLTILRNGDEIFPSMLEAIGSAEHSVDLVTFVYWTGEIADRFARELAAAAERGCRVRVLLDAVGARHIDDRLLDELDASGVDVRWFRPVLEGGTLSLGKANHRTHRKVLVCDASVGFTGGVGIAQEWTGDARNEREWRDTHVRICGPAVAGLQAAFLDNWADAPVADRAAGDGEDGGRDEYQFDARDERLARLDAAGTSTCIVVRGAAETGASAMRRLLIALIQLAEQRLRIATAYFNPDDEFVDALVDAVARGVEVQLLVPGEHHDKRFVQMSTESRYQRLLDDGVEIRTYERSMMHAKVVTVDGSVATIGSANFNDRSMRHDEECNVVVLDPHVVAQLDRHFDDDLALTSDLDPRRWGARSPMQKLGEKLAAITDRWL